MGPPSCMWSLIDRNVVMRHMTVNHHGPKNKWWKEVTVSHTNIMAACHKTGMSSSSAPVTLCSKEYGSSKAFPSFSAVSQPLYFTPGLSTFIGFLLYSSLPGLSGASLSPHSMGIRCSADFSISPFSSLNTWHNHCHFFSNLPQVFIWHHFWPSHA